MVGAVGTRFAGVALGGALDTADGGAAAAGNPGCPGKMLGAAERTAAGKAAPQKPQNLLPAGSSLRQVVQMTWLLAGEGSAGSVGALSGCRGFPHRVHFAPGAPGLGIPQDGQRT